MILLLMFVCKYYLYYVLFVGYRYYRFEFYRFVDVVCLFLLEDFIVFFKSNSRVFWSFLYYSL